MGSTSYNSKLRDARWQRKRLEIMERDGFKCRSCGKGEHDSITLNVHHAYYEKGKNPWEYPNHTMTTVCDVCHEDISRDLQIISDWVSGLCAYERSGVVQMALAGASMFPRSVMDSAVRGGCFDDECMAMVTNAMSKHAVGLVEDKGGAA